MEKAVWTLTCTACVALSSSTIVLVLDRWLRDETEYIVYESHVRDSNSEQAVEETQDPRETEWSVSLASLKSDYAKRIKMKENEEKEELYREIDVTTILPRVFRLVGQHLITPIGKFIHYIYPTKTANVTLTIVLRRVDRWIESFI
eukprot:jgi/Galph1/4205/GphlegSOOS_G2821.1